jgi:hypothetical protein
MSANLTAPYQKFLMQLDILEKEFFLKDLLFQVDQAYQVGVEGFRSVEQIERLMQYWQSQVLLSAHKDAEMLFTDEQLTALSSLKKHIEALEKQLELERANLEVLDTRQRSLISSLVNQDSKDAGSQLLAAALADFWRQLIEVRSQNVAQRQLAVTDFITKMKSSAPSKPPTIAV